MGRNGVVLIKDHFLLIFISADDLEIVRPKVLIIDFLDAVDELDRSSVAVLREEGYGGFPIFYILEDATDALVHK